MTCKVYYDWRYTKERPRLFGIFPRKPIVKTGQSHHYVIAKNATMAEDLLARHCTRWSYGHWEYRVVYGAATRVTTIPSLTLVWYGDQEHTYVWNRSRRTA